MPYMSYAQVRTRKPHRCWGCVEVFPAGSEMHRWVNKDGGKLVTTYWCVPCQDYINERCKHDRYLADDGFEEGYVKEAREEDAMHQAATDAVEGGK